MLRAFEDQARRARVERRWWWVRLACRGMAYLTAGQLLAIALMRGVGDEVPEANWWGVAGTLVVQAILSTVLTVRNVRNLTRG